MSEGEAGAETMGPGRTAVSPSTSGSADVSAVNLKLPPFWPADPELWFAQVEAQFACRRITSQKSRFDHVVSSLSPDYAAEVRDLLLRPPADNPYTALKEQLTKRTALSEQRRLQQLFSEELGDRKPIQLLRRMQQLLGDRPGIDPSFLQELFLQRLPQSVRMVLASTPEGTALSKLAEMVDKVMEVTAPSSSVAALKTHSPSDPPAPPTPTPSVPLATAADIEDLRSEISRLEKLVRNLARPHSSFRSSARSTRSPRRSPTPTPSLNTDSSDHTLCWYHRKFGDRARDCRSPCSWSSNGQAGH